MGLNGSSLLLPALGYDKIEKKKAIDAGLTQNAIYVLLHSRHYCSNGGYFRPLKIV